MLYNSLVCKLGGVRITVSCCLVKSGGGKTWVMMGEMGCDEVKKESREDMFLPLFADKLFYNGTETRRLFVNINY